MANQEHPDDMSSVPDSLFGHMPAPSRSGGGGANNNNNDDATSVPGSLFGHLPVASSQPASSAATALTVRATPTQQEQDSYVDFYASLGADHRATTPPQRAGGGGGVRGDTIAFHDDLETSLLISEGDALESGAARNLRRGGGGRGGGPPTRANSTWFADNRTVVNLIVITSAVIFTVALLFWVVESGTAHKHDRVIHLNWRQPKAYQVSFLLTLANGLKEPGIAFVDEVAQQQHISYWNGMTTYIFSKPKAWSILPRLDKLACFVEDFQQLVPLFPPNLDQFIFKRTVELTLPFPPLGIAKRNKKKDTVTCDEWEYSPVVTSEEQGFYGRYLFWTTTTDAGLIVPVRFSFAGSAVILGEKHFDSYVLDYYSFTELAAQQVDPFWLLPPKNMPCMELGERAIASSSGQRLAQFYAALFPITTGEESSAQAEYAAFRKLHSSRREDTVERRNLFVQTQRMIDMHNRDANKSYKLGINFMADWTARERDEFANGLRDDPAQAGCAIDHYHALREPLTEKVVDYISKGQVRQPGEEQGTCSNGWAFAATGAIEGQIARMYGQDPPVALSLQNLLDCSWPRDATTRPGCAPGSAPLAFAWMIEHNQGRVATADSYPFLGQDGFCHFDLKRGLVHDGALAQDGVKGVAECYHVTDQYLGGNNQTAEQLIEYFNYKLVRVGGPLAVSISASAQDFYFYKSGVYDNPECKSGAQDLTHQVLAVGFDLDADKPFTRIRNNWGMFWGERGYARIAQRDNICGVATAATYVLLDPRTRRPTSSVPSTHPTPAPTEPPTDVPVTPPPTEPVTPPPTEPVTPPPTEPVTDAPVTPPPTEPPTEPPVTPPPTEPPTEPPVTPPPTEPPVTPPPTEPPVTPPPTEPPVTPTDPPK